MGLAARQVGCLPRVAVGANCSVPGIELEFLPLYEGFWRDSSGTTDVRRCLGSASGSACIGCSGSACYMANFSGCKRGLTGPYCGLCLEAEEAVVSRVQHPFAHAERLGRREAHLAHPRHKLGDCRSHGGGTERVSALEERPFVGG